MKSRIVSALFVMVLLVGLVGAALPAQDAAAHASSCYPWAALKISGTYNYVTGYGNANCEHSTPGTSYVRLYRGDGTYLGGASKAGYSAEITRYCAEGGSTYVGTYFGFMDDYGNWTGWKWSGWYLVSGLTC